MMTRMSEGRPRRPGRRRRTSALSMMTTTTRTSETRARPDHGTFQRPRYRLQNVLRYYTPACTGNYYNCIEQGSVVVVATTTCPGVEMPSRKTIATSTGGRGQPDEVELSLISLSFKSQHHCTPELTWLLAKSREQMDLTRRKWSKGWCSSSSRECGAWNQILAVKPLKTTPQCL